MIGLQGTQIKAGGSFTATAGAAGASSIAAAGAGVATGTVLTTGGAMLSASLTAGMSPDSAVVLAKVMSATAGLLVSGGDATQVNVAATMGMNAVANNFCTGNACFNRRFNLSDAIEQWRNGNGVTVTDVQASEPSIAEVAYRLFRNTETAVGAAVNGSGTPYKIQFTGTIPAPDGLPR